MEYKHERETVFVGLSGSGCGTAVTILRQHSRKTAKVSEYESGLKSSLLLRSWERTCDSSSDRERFTRGNTATPPTCSRPVHNFLAGGNGGSQLWQAQFTTPRPRFTTRFTAFGWETDPHDKTCRPTSIFGRHPFWEGVLSLAPLPALYLFLIAPATIPPPPTANLCCRRH